MRAAIIERPGEISIGSVDDPTPKAEEIVVRVGACGICGTDLHIADGEFPPTPYPIIPGHEFAGEIVTLGPGVEDLSEGARVAIDPSLLCGKCEFCRRGSRNLCQNWGAIGDTVAGGFAEYVSVPAANAYVLPEEISYREAALIEPLACAVHGVRKLDPQIGDNLLIVGAGTMGLMLLQLALRGGASEVSVLDLNTERLRLAERLGAARTATDASELIESEPLGFDCVIDATGVPQAIEAAFDAVRRGGKLLVFGVAPDEARISLSPFRIYNDEITVLGSMAILNSYAPAVDLMLAGVVDGETLLTRPFPLEKYPAALETVRRGEGLKTQVTPGG